MWFLQILMSFFENKANQSKFLGKPSLIYFPCICLRPGFQESFKPPWYQFQNEVSSSHLKYKVHIRNIVSSYLKYSWISWNIPWGYQTIFWKIYQTMTHWYSYCETIIFVCHPWLKKISRAHFVKRDSKSYFLWEPMQNNYILNKNSL